MEEVFFRKVATAVILAALLVLSFFILQPILMAIIIGFILAFIFSPVYNKLYKLTKLKTIPSFVICILLLALIILPLWFFMPSIINESIKLYQASQQLDIVTPLKAIFPSLFGSETFSQEVGSVIQSSITTLTNSLMNYLSGVILQFPTIILQIFVVFFTLFFTLKDKDKVISYIKSLLPFSKEVEQKLFDYTRDITFSVLYGYIIIGIIQGTILGIGLFVFGVPNAFVLMLLGIVAGILPLIGPAIIGVPTAIFLFVGGDPVSAWGILLFTLIASFSDYLIRPTLIARRVQLHQAVVLVGMIGGFLLFGILGFILGPLIFAYLIIIMEVYRNKTIPSALLQKDKQ